MTKQHILHFKILNSTQEKAQELLAQKKATDGLIIIAQQQTHGIGRLNRSWHSPEGGLWMSSIITKKLPAMITRGLSVRLGLALCLFFEKEYDIQCKIKWPNDLLYGEKKLAGILIDYSTVGAYLNHLIIGLGLNVNNVSKDFPVELQDSCISLREIFGEKIPKRELTLRIIQEQKILLESLAQNNLPAINNLWATKSYTFNQMIQVKTNEQEMSGIEKGVTSTGELMLYTSSGEMKKIVFGDVQLVRKIE
jgi:BirA family biotin operon repressor/biotin-[acetyl-CoA-carboxylase] ligase